MRGKISESLFINENTMKYATIIAVICGIASVAVMGYFHEMTLVILFEKTIKVLISGLALWSFIRYHWDVMKGIMGGLLFSLLYQEAYLVLGNLWGATADFDAYLIMGVEGSLYLAAQTMSLMMTFIIIINHFIIEYSRKGNPKNLVFNKLSILFKLALYLALIVINIFLDLPSHQLVYAGLGYVADFAVVIMLVCIEAQLDSFKAIKQELLQAKRKRVVA